MTHVEAYTKAAATGTIKVKAPTMAIMKAVAEFHEAHERMMDTIINNLADTLNDNETIDRFTDEYYRHFHPAMEEVYAMVGRSVIGDSFSMLEFRGL